MTTEFRLKMKYDGIWHHPWAISCCSLFPILAFPIPQNENFVPHH